MERQQVSDFESDLIFNLVPRWTEGYISMWEFCSSTKLLQCDRRTLETGVLPALSVIINILTAIELAPGGSRGS